MNVPTSTIEKPLTAVDYIAALSYAATPAEVRTFTAQLPPEVQQDERYQRAEQQILAQLVMKATA